jgi:hypothetical protein
MLENVVEYVKNGDRIGQAFRRASEQTEMGKDGDTINAIALALQKKIEYYPQNKKGIKPVNSEETVSGFEDLMRDITTSIKNHSDEPDMFGGARSMGDTLQAGIDSHFRKNALTEAESLQSRRAENPIARMRQLSRKRQEEGPNRYETDELTSLEKRAGQHFMGFFDEARKTPDFSLESLKVAFLDKDDRVIHSQVLFVGTLNESIAAPRDILISFQKAKEKSPGIVSALIAHNHPSGDPAPSMGRRVMKQGIRVMPR